MKRIIQNNNRRSKGQTAIVLIFLIAVALVFYTASLNWTKVVQNKALTTVASNKAAANMASMMASYGEQVVQVTLGGSSEVCKKTNFLVLLTNVIVAIVLAVVTVGNPLAVIGAILAIAALIINLTVVEPGLTRLWNKMQQSIPLDGQIIEGAVLVGAQSVLTDSEMIQDHFDMDIDGQWVNNAGVGNIGQRQDRFTRFGYYYTRRLQRAQPNRIPEVQEFKLGLNELLYDNPYNKVGPPPGGCSNEDFLAGSITCQNPDHFGIFDPGCNGTIPNPYCNPCCLPEFQSDGVTPLRSESCTLDQVALCTSGDYPVSQYQYQYDPYYENYDNAFYSFRELLGVDDENAFYNRSAINPNPPPPQSLANQPNNIFRKEDATGYYTAAVQASLGIAGGTPDKRKGIFPFFWNMSNLLPAEPYSHVPPPLIPNIPRPDGVVMMTADSGNCTIIDCPNKFVASPMQCPISLALDNNINRPRPDGIWWKPGADQYCSNTYPYNDCINYVGNCSEGTFTGTVPVCGCEASDNPALWHDDNADNLIYGLEQFINWSKELLNYDDNKLQQEFTTWYQESAFWIAPRCSAAADCENPATTSLECNYCNRELNDGMLIVWRDMLGSWIELLDTWLYRTTFENDNYWCLPTRATANAQMLPEELNSIPSINPATTIPTDKDGNNIPLVWGDLNDTIACLNHNSTNLSKLNTCSATCNNNPTSYTANADACLNLPRSVVIDLKSSSAITAENIAYQNAQKLQDCLSSVCQDSGGNVLEVCANLPVPISVTASCAGWPTNPFFNAVKAERDVQFNISNYCERATAGTPTSFQANLSIAIDAATYQDPILIQRRDQLLALRSEALQVRDTFLKGYENFSLFLKPCSPGLALGEGCEDCTSGGPAAKLICARKYYLNRTGLSNFVIYGWQSKPVSGRGADGTDPEKGYWHIIRSEAFAPQRCYRSCGASRLPWVRTHTHQRGFNRIRCYTLTDRSGMVISRVTRYDEDHDSPGVRLFNGQFLWNFRYTNPGVISNVVPGNVLAQDCKHPLAYEEGLSEESKRVLDGSFMINDAPVNDPTVSLNCYDVVNTLLSRGVQSTTCAQYYYDDSIRHMNLKFIPCSPQVIDIVTTCARLGTCGGG